MKPAPLPDNEAQRLARLRALTVLDSPPEALFDAFTRLAASIAGTPIALVSLIDAERQWFKSQVGLPGVSGTPRELAFCAHAILDNALMEVSDTLADTRFADNPLVTGEPGIRFYAGAPITLADGSRMGTLCVIDRQPRQLDTAQRSLLVELAAAVSRALELRERSVVSALATRSAHEAELTGHLRELNSVLDLLPVAVTVWDRDQRNTYANEQARRQTGTLVPLVPGTPLAHSIGAAAVAAQVAQHEAVLQGEPQTFEIQVPHDDGLHDERVQLLPWRDGDGAIAGHVALVEDVTAERAVRAARKAIEQSERKFHTLADASPLGVFHTDADGLCTYSNERWQQIYGLALAESLGEGWSRMLHPDDRAAVSTAWQRSATSGAAFAMDFRILRPDGKVCHVRSWARPLRNAEGAIDGFVGVVDDVTALHTALGQLRESEAQVNALDSLLAERSEMLQVLAHEVRQPLNNASAALQSAAAVLAGHGQHEALARLARAQQVMASVQASVNNTLAAATVLADGTPPTLGDVDIDTLINVTLRDLADAERARVQVQRATATRTATMDMSLMRLALRNVLANALAHSPPDHGVVLRIADSDEPLALLIDVIDRGPGIDPALLPRRLFEQGVRGRGSDARPGHGLGLYIVRRVLELHSGQAEVLETGPAGTVMRLAISQAQAS